MTTSAARSDSDKRLGIDRPRLSKDGIVEAALTLLDTGATFSFRALGRTLGVDHTAIYRHLRDKDELVLAITDRMIADALVDFAPADDWRDTIRDLCARVRRAYLRHPHAAMLVAPRTARQPHEFAMVEGWTQALLAAGLSPADAALYFRVLADITLAYVALEATYRGLDPEARRGDERSWSQEYLALPPEQYPHIAVVATHLPGIDVDTVFDTAIASIINTIEATARSDDSTG